MMRSRSRQLIHFFAIALLTLGASQAIGYWINSKLAINESWELSGFLYFTHVRNFGGVFGMLQGSGSLFAVFSLLLLAGVVAYLALSRQVRHYEYICFGFIVGGGLSNIIDRLVYGSVIDFIDIQHIPYWNYVFNTADVMIHVGIWPMLLLSLKDSVSQGRAE